MSVKCYVSFKDNRQCDYSYSYSFISATSGDLESLLTVGKDLEAHGEVPRQFFHATVSVLLKEHSEEAPFVLAGSERLTDANHS